MHCTELAIAGVSLSLYSVQCNHSCTGDQPWCPYLPTGENEAVATTTGQSDIRCGISC